LRFKKFLFSLQRLCNILVGQFFCFFVLYFFKIRYLSKFSSVLPEVLRRFARIWGEQLPPFAPGSYAYVFLRRFVFELETGTGNTDARTDGRTGKIGNSAY